MTRLRDRIEFLERRLKRAEAIVERLFARRNLIEDELVQLRKEREAPHGMVEADVIRWLESRGYMVKLAEDRAA